MTLLDQRNTYRPFEYETAYRYFEDACLTHWTWTKVGMSGDILDWKTMTQTEKNIVAGVLNGFTITETVVGDYWSNKVNKWFPKPEVVAMATTFSAMECFDDQTQLLTSKGWKDCKEIDVNDLVAQYDLTTKEISFAKPEKVWSYKYKGLMHLYESKTTNICVTPNHDLIAINSDTQKVSKLKSYQSKLEKKYLYPTSGEGIGESKKLTVYDKILIASQAAAYIEPNKTVIFSLRKQKQIDKICNLLDKAEIKYYITTEDKGELVNIHFYLLETTDINQVKSLKFLDLETISASQAVEVIKELSFWYDSKKVFDLINKEAADVIQTIAVLSNLYTATVSSDTNTYTVSITKKNKIGYPKKEEIEYDGYVYCVSVNKQNVISRRNGKVAFTGNCIHARSYNNLIESLGLEEYDPFEQDTIVKKRLENLIETPGETVENIARSLAIFSGFCEGVCLFSSFAILKYFPTQNKLKGVGTIIDYSIKDEQEHSQAGCWLFRQLLEEMPNIDCKFNYSLLRENVYKGAHTVIELETKFIDEIFANNELDGLNPNDLKEYIKYRTNLKLNELGYEPNISVDSEAANKIRSWFDVSTGSQKQQDFFVQNPTDYTKNALAIDDANLDFNLDF